LSMYETVDDYIEDQPEATKKTLASLKDCILAAVPDAIEMFNYGIPAFALIKNGKRDQQIMMAGYEKHVGLYPHPTTMEKFADELKGYKKGKGSVQFPINEPLPRELIIEMIRWRKKTINED